MSRFTESAEDVLAAVGAGATMREACTRLDIPYATARTWVANGRRDPEGPYGAFVRRLDAAKAPPADDPHRDEDSSPGAVETRVNALVSGCELNRQVALAAEQAKVLARAIDELGSTPGGAAKTALASCSRRLEELIPLLEAPREDLVDRLRAERSQRRGSRPIDHWSPAKTAEHSADSNGKESGVVESERGSAW
jgi:hypothetical protein